MNDATAYPFRLTVSQCPCLAQPMQFERGRSCPAPDDCCGRISRGAFRASLPPGFLLLCGEMLRRFAGGVALYQLGAYAA